MESHLRVLEKPFDKLRYRFRPPSAPGVRGTDVTFRATRLLSTMDKELATKIKFGFHVVQVPIFCFLTCSFSLCLSFCLAPPTRSLGKSCWCLTTVWVLSLSSSVLASFISSRRGTSFTVAGSIPLVCLLAVLCQVLTYETSLLGRHSRHFTSRFPVFPAMCLRALYGTPGTDRAYGAARRDGSLRARQGGVQCCAPTRCAVLSECMVRAGKGSCLRFFSPDECNEHPERGSKPRGPPL